MKIVIATDSFKGCCTSVEAATAFEKGIRKVFPEAEVVKIPIADGGEGTVEALVSGVGGRFKYIEVTNPLGNRVFARYGILEDTIAVMEMSSASGITLIPESARNPLKTTTFGTGELIKDALDSGCRKIFIGIGGSATNDGGAGMAQALGASLVNIKGSELGYGGGELGTLARIDVSRIDPRLSECEITALCDVTNPLCGKSGASHVYGPQKGATPDMVETLDSNLRHFAELIHSQLGKDVINIPGSGAAGGLGAGLMAFCNASLKPGIETILSLTNLESHLNDAHLVITGEGRVDSQSSYGKVPAGVARIAKKFKLPVVALAGSIGEGASSLYGSGVDSIMCIANGPITIDESIRNFESLAQDAAERMMRLISIDI